jgi:hypothetical protein
VSCRRYFWLFRCLSFRHDFWGQSLPHSFYTVTGTEAASVIRSWSPNCGHHIFVKVVGGRRLCIELCHIFFQWWNQSRLDAWDILHYLNAEELHGILVGNPEAKSSVGRLGLRYELQVNTRHLSLSWARSIHSTPLHPTSWRSILILFSHLCLGLPNGIFLSGAVGIKVIIAVAAQIHCA